MGHATRLARAWLDARYQRRTESGVFVAHQPVYGPDGPWEEAEPCWRLARLVTILRLLDGVRFETLLDVGGGDGFVAHLVRRVFGAEVVSADLSVEAGKRARELFDVPVVACDAARLPFADRAFDVVLCSEMIEHVEHPLETLLELERVAGKLLVVTSEEFSADRGEVDHKRATRLDLPHSERNAFHVDELRMLFGAELEWRSQFAAQGDPPSRAELASWLAAGAGGEPREGVGGVLLRWRDRTARAARCHGDAALVDALLGSFVPAVPAPARSEPTLAPALDARLVCPRCHGEVVAEAARLACTRCAGAFPLSGGVPDFYDAREPDPGERELEGRLDAAGRDPAACAALLALRRALTIPDATKRAWDFTAAPDRTAWTANAVLAPRAGAPGSVGIAWSALGSGGWIVSPQLVFPPPGVAALEIEMRIWNPAFPVDAATSQVFWLAEGDLDFSEAQKLAFRPVNDGRVHRYRVELAAHPRFPAAGAPFWLRLDPVDGPGEVDLVALRFLAPGA
jgi:SAM-dependent methyltransferase